MKMNTDTFDPNDFFRQVTLKICGTLNMGRAMMACCSYLRQFMPADELLLNYYDPALDLIRTITRADSRNYTGEEEIIKIPDDFDVPEYLAAWPRIQICNDPETDPLNRIMLRAYGMKECSLMQMFLETEEMKFGLGHLTLVARGYNRYQPGDLKLFKLLKEPFSIASSNMLHHRRILTSRETLQNHTHYLQDELFRLTGNTIIGADGGLKKVMRNVRLVAPRASTVLLTGETGVGKDVLATAIHNLSPREKNPFIKINCGAIPENLIDSELFGHEKGAFTGAFTKKTGRFERAHSGTIFLDEIGELPPDAQVRLLRVLQSGEFEPVGSGETKSVDARVIAATNRDLEALVKRGLFREDLWFRLNVFPIHIPPLRERKEDIKALILHIIRKKVADLQLPVLPELARGELEYLLDYPWPGNIRELENIIERALILCDSDTVSLLSLLRIPGSRTPPGARISGSAGKKLDAVIRQHILQVLHETKGRINGPGGAAEILDINPGTLRNRMKKLKIPFGRKQTY